MRLYSAENLENLQTLKLLRHWQTENLLTEEQAQQFHTEAASDLRTTNIFLRIVLFLFTIIIVGCGTALLFLIAFQGTQPHLAIPLLLVAIACYAAAEFAVKESRFYHFGIEEALVAFSIGSLYAGLLFGHGDLREGSDPAGALILVVCAGVSLWTWYRFGYWYTFVAGMVFIAFVPHYLTTSLAAQHSLVALLYLAGLVAVIAAASRHRLGHLQRLYSAAEAFLWAGIYLSINLVPYVWMPQWLDDSGPARIPHTFYWLTWILIWCMPPTVLVRGIRRKDRILLSLGAALAVVTLICNKPYLGWQRHTWDPMLLGAVLAGAIWFLQRWLAAGPGGTRNGFTAARITGKKNGWITAAPAAFSLLVPHSIGQHPQPDTPAQPLGDGGASGGGGAGGSF